jgi:type IV fimbrial biogenesis protein FimT
MDLGRAAGFTIIELIVVLSIVAILSALAAPDLAMFIKNNRVKGQTFDLLNTIQYARSEAAKRRVRVIMCRSANPTAASPTCGGTANTWTTGWLVFASGDTNSTYETANDTLLRIGPPAPMGVTVRTNTTCNQNLEYNPDGTTNASGGIARFAICDTSRGGAYGRQIVVPPHGRPKLEQGSQSSPINCTSPT